MKTTRNVLALLVLSAVAASPAIAQKIYAGSKTGSYTNDFCPEVEKALRKEYFEHECTISQGTGDNVEKVTADPKSVALGQFDVVAARALENPDALSIVDPGLGLECLYAVTTDASITSLKGLSPRMPIALPSEKSGSAATFQFLQTLDEGLASLRKVTHHKSAMEAVQSVIKGEAALAFFVQFANTNNPVFEAINEAKLKFIPVINRSILRHEVAGYNVYQPQQVVVTSAGWGSWIGKEPTRIDTTCTPVVLFTGNPGAMAEGSVERKDQEDVVKLLTQVQPPSSGDWTDIFANTVAIGKDKMNELIDKYSN